MMHRAMLVLWGLVAMLGIEATAAEKEAEKKGTLVRLDGLSSRTPADWKEVETTSRFRYKHFTLPRAEGDKEDAELIIFYFGPGGGGGAEENVTRWKKMFQPPEGKEIDDVAKVDKFKVGQVPVTYLDIRGTYLSRKRPFDPNEKPEPKPNYRMLAVIFESPKGPYYLRLVGPEKTVGHHKKGFDEWLKNFQ